MAARHKSTPKTTAMASQGVIFAFGVALLFATHAVAQVKGMFKYIYIYMMLSYVFLKSNIILLLCVCE